MTEKKKYPEEIYPKLGFRTDGFGRLTYRTTFNSDFECAYDLGYKHGQLEVRRDGLDPVDTWTRLTTSNPDWDRIDWSALYERPVLLRHVPSFSNVCTKIVSKGPYTVSYDDGPREIPADQALLLKALPRMTHSSLHGATQAALEDRDGWALYVLGELPLRKQTADQLAPGTCFRARYTGVHYTHTHSRAQIVQVGDKTHVACFNEHFNSVTAMYNNLADIEVLEVYGVGTFQTPKENA